MNSIDTVRPMRDAQSDYGRAFMRLARALANT